MSSARKYWKALLFSSILLPPSPTIAQSGQWDGREPFGNEGFYRVDLYSTAVLEATDPLQALHPNATSGPAVASSSRGAPFSTASLSAPTLPPIQHQQVNPDYWYRDNDIHHLLTLRLQQEGLLPSRDDATRDIQLLPPLSPSLEDTEEGRDVEHPLVTHLRQERERHGDRERTIILPYNPTHDHWVGIGIYIKATGRVQVFYLDPRGSSAPFEVERAIQAIYGPETSLQEIRGRVQCDGSACGPLTVENLVDLVRGEVPQLTVTNSTLIRQRHIALMEHAHPEVDFLERQRLNQYGFSYQIGEPAAENTPLYHAHVFPHIVEISPEDKEKIDQTLAILNHILKNEQRGIGAYSPERLRAEFFSPLFNTISDIERNSIAFPIQLKYRQIPWNKLRGWYWWVSHGEWEPLSQHLWDVMMEAGDFAHLHAAFSAVAENRAIPDASLPALARIHTIADYFYGQEVLTDLEQRIQEFQSSEETEMSSGEGGASEGSIASTGKGKEPARETEGALSRHQRSGLIAALRTLQVIGEYFHQFNGLPPSLNAQTVKGRDTVLSSIRNVLSHSTLLALQRFVATFPPEQYAPLMRAIRAMGPSLQKLLATRHLPNVPSEEVLIAEGYLDPPSPLTEEEENSPAVKDNKRQARMRDIEKARAEWAGWNWMPRIQAFSEGRYEDSDSFAFPEDHLVTLRHVSSLLTQSETESARSDKQLSFFNPACLEYQLDDHPSLRYSEETKTALRSKREAKEKGQPAQKYPQAIEEEIKEKEKQRKSIREEIRFDQKMTRKEILDNLVPTYSPETRRYLAQQRKAERELRADMAQGLSLQNQLLAVLNAEDSPNAEEMEARIRSILDTLVTTEQRDTVLPFIQRFIEDLGAINNELTTKKEELSKKQQKTLANQKRQKVQEAREQLKSLSLIRKTLPETEESIEADLRAQKDTRKAIKEALIGKVDAHPDNRVEAFGDFARALKNAGVHLPQSNYWQDVPSYLETVFARMLGQPLHTPDQKRAYRRELIRQAQDTIAMVQELLGLQDITFEQELGDERNGIHNRDAYKAAFFRSDFSASTFNYAVTRARLDELLSTYPFRARVLEFLVGLGYEHLRDVLYLPDFRKSLQRRVQIRNFYNHPDPTYRRPLIIWDKEQIDDATGSITMRPDIGEGFYHVLLKEAARLCIGIKAFIDKALEGTEESVDQGASTSKHLEEDPSSSGSH